MTPYEIRRCQSDALAAKIRRLEQRGAKTVRIGHGTEIHDAGGTAYHSRPVFSLREIRQTAEACGWSVDQIAFFDTAIERLVERAS